MTLFAGLVLTVSAAAAAAAADPGIAIGKSIPKFQLKDQFGKTRSFQSIKGPKGAMIVFYRSADW